MKKILLPINILFLFSLSSAQTQRLVEDFSKTRQDYEKKFDALISKHQTLLSRSTYDSLKVNLAGFAGGIPLFYSVSDGGANKASNADELQSGSVTGSTILGNGIKLTVFDEGRVHDTHEQFSTERAVNKETTSYAKSAHTTQVNSLIMASGAITGTFSQGGVSYDKSLVKGVLPMATVDNYKYALTDLGDNYQKLASLPNLNISNHSYGISVGWAYISTAALPYYPTAGWYWVGNYEMNSLDTYSGFYATQDESFDKIVYAQPQQIIFKSAGNNYGLQPAEGVKRYKWSSAQGKYVEFEPGDVIPEPNCSLGYNCLGYGSVAKNIITVGSVNQLDTEDGKYHNSTDDVVKAQTSGAGPRKDGAIKPDLVAVGQDVVLANYSSSTPSANNLYNVSFGTSYATAVVSGIAGALTQVQRNISGNSSFVFYADEMKALLTHTAMEAGRPGPDVWYGWGLVDAKKSAQLLMNRAAGISLLERENLGNQSTYTKLVKANGSEPLKVSISWVDPAITPFTSEEDIQQNHSSRLVNDLDLRVINTTTNEVYYPWRLDISNPNANATKGDNTVDTVEQVLIDAPTSDTVYRIEVSHKGNLVNQDGDLANQYFALVATGIVDDETLAVNDVAKDIKIYPNPTTDIVRINYNQNIDRVALFDTNANMLLEKTNAKVDKLDLKQYPSGVYLLLIQTNGKTTVHKIIKK